MSKLNIIEMIMRQDELMGKLTFVKEAIDQMVAREESDTKYFGLAIYKCWVTKKERLLLSQNIEFKS